MATYVPEEDVLCKSQGAGALDHDVENHSDTSIVGDAVIACCHSLEGSFCNDITFFPWRSGQRSFSQKTSDRAWESAEIICSGDINLWR